MQPTKPARSTSEFKKAWFFLPKLLLWEKKAYIKLFPMVVIHAWVAETIMKGMMLPDDKSQWNGNVQLANLYKEIQCKCFTWFWKELHQLRGLPQSGTYKLRDFRGKKLTKWKAALWTDMHQRNSNPLTGTNKVSAQTQNEALSKGEKTWHKY